MRRCGCGGEHDDRDGERRARRRASRAGGAAHSAATVHAASSVRRAVAASQVGAAPDSDAGDCATTRAGSVTPWTSRAVGRTAVVPRGVAAAVVRSSASRSRRAHRRAPASAHTASGPRPTNYLTTLGSISPRIPGVTVRVVELGNKLELTNRTRTDVVVLGYDGEPYLRVGPRGLYENLRSPATYLNRTRAGTTPFPRSRRAPARRRRRAGIASRVRTPRSGTTTAFTGWERRRPPSCSDDPGAFHTIDPAVDGRVPLRRADRGGARPARLGSRAERVAVGVARRSRCSRSVRRGRARAAARPRSPRSSCSSVSTWRTRSARKSRGAGTQLAKTVQFFGDNFVSVIVWVAAAITIWGLLAPAGRSALRRAARRRDGRARERRHATSRTSGSRSCPTVGPHVLARAEVVDRARARLRAGGGRARSRLRRSTPRCRARAAHDPRWLERLVAGLDDDEVARRVRPARRGRGDPARPRRRGRPAGRRSRPISAPTRSCSSCSRRTRSVRTCGASRRRGRVARPARAARDARRRRASSCGSRSRRSCAVLGGTRHVASDRRGAPRRELDVDGDRAFARAVARARCRFGRGPVSTV